jgi:glycosyltransferase involved in cell wall biosynthesis
MDSSSPSPVVSVLMSVYDGEKHLSETLDTLLGQTLPDFELVVVDDGSRDRTPEILEAYAARDPRIRRTRNERNLGLPVGLNRGLALCRAPLIARADADDLYVPRYLETQVGFLAANPSVGVVSSAFEIADADGRVLHLRRLPTADPQIRFGLLFMSRLFHPTATFRSALVREVGGYAEAFWTAQDYELWSRLYERTRFANQPVPLARYRRHPGATVARRGEPGELLSRSVTRRLLSGYLGRRLSLEEARLARILYYGKGDLGIDDLRRACELFERILERAREAEDAETLGRFRRRISTHLMERSRTLAEVDREAGRHFFWRSMRWYPARSRTGTLKYLGRLYGPRWAVEPARRWLRSRGRA